MTKKENSKRQLTITEDTVRIDPSLYGTPLAGVFRRGLAILLDLILIVIVSIPILFGVAYMVISIENPVIIEKLHQLRKEESSEKREQLLSDFERETARLIYKRMPERMSGEFQLAFENSDSTAIDSLVDLYYWNFHIAFSDEPITSFNAEEKTALVGMYAFVGQISIIANFGMVLIVYFTLFTWLTKGFSPGKWVLRIRVVRLDNRRLNLIHSFDRAGGYGASIATLGLGFFEAFWHPNRQTIHDRISETVVVRLVRKKKANKVKNK